MRVHHLNCGSLCAHDPHELAREQASAAVTTTVG